MANYFANQKTPLSINQVNKFGFGDSGASMYSRIAGREVDPKDKKEILSLRPRVLSAIANNGASINYIKTHNANAVAFRDDLIPPQLTRCAIYIIRNPLDVSLSFAKHFGHTVERAVELMSRDDFLIRATNEYATEFVGSWSGHAASWCARSRIPVRAFRYEDMLARPHDSFAAMLKHAGIPVDPDRLDKAVRFASFDEVSKQEEEEGFVERSENADRFFAYGKVGRWKTELASKLAKRIRRDHRDVMKKFGYLE